MVTPAPNPYLSEAADNASRLKAEPRGLVGYQGPGREEVQLVFLFPLWFWLCKTGLSLKIPCIQNLLLPARHAPQRCQSTAALVLRKRESLVYTGIAIGLQWTPTRTSSHASSQVQLAKRESSHFLSPSVVSELTGHLQILICML